jgi:RNA polymerase primary sigma factor
MPEKTPKKKETTEKKTKKETTKKETTKKETTKKKPVKETIHTIGLKKAFEAPEKKRGKAATKIIKNYIRKHTRKEPRVDPELNKSLWKRGPKPPRKIKVRIVEEKTGDQETATAVLP